MAEAKGIRLYHPTARNGYFTFEHNKRPYQRWNPVLKRHEAVPHFCPVCAKFHVVKTYHVHVDSEGFAFVSLDIWNLMKRHGAAGFVIANDVNNPPSQQIGVGNGPVVLQVAQEIPGNG